MFSFFLNAFVITRCHELTDITTVTIDFYVRNIRRNCFVIYLLYSLTDFPVVIHDCTIVFHISLLLLWDVHSFIHIRKFWNMNEQ